jgi:hypothetical protein
MIQVVQGQLAPVVEVVPVEKMAPLKGILVLKATPVPVVKVTLVVLQVQNHLEATPDLKGQGNLTLRK